MFHFSPDELNSVHNPDMPDLKPTAKSTVMKEDRDPDPITNNVFKCALADFMAGNYNVSVSRWRLCVEE